MTFHCHKCNVDFEAAPLFSKDGEKVAYHVCVEPHEVDGFTEQEMTRCVAQMEAA